MKKTFKMADIFLENIILITFGGTRDKKISRCRIRKISGGDRSFYQEEKIIDNKAYHRNLEENEIVAYIHESLAAGYKNAVIYTDGSDYYLRTMKKGALSIIRREPTKSNLSPGKHNIEKKYLIPEGESVGFLIELGIMDSKGQVFKKHYSKFRQINRFLELLDDDYDRFRDREIISVADLCCGKGYLTLAIHHFFTSIKGKKTEILGMDLKQDVIDKLNDITNKLMLDGIRFEYGDIKDAKLIKPDLVVALHACDTATDLALAKAVEAGTGLIMSVPCCQHELFKQIKNEDLSPILKYGIMKDKFTELSTNALRGLALEAQGYKVRMIEFTSLEHTMKNIMIKAVHDGALNKNSIEEFHSFSNNINVNCSAKWILDVNKNNEN